RRTIELHRQAVAVAQAVTLVADGDVDRALEHPHLLMDADVARARLEGDARPGRELDLDDLHGLRRAQRRHVSPDVAGGRVAPEGLIVAPGDRTAARRRGTR